MKAGGFQSDVIFEPGPRQSQVLHLQMRWYLFEGDNLAKVPIPALLVLSLRDSVNLTPGGPDPFGACRNAVLLGFAFPFCNHRPRPTSPPPDGRGRRAAPRYREHG